MAGERLTENQREILRIYQETSKRKKTEDFFLTRKDLSNRFLRRPEVDQSGRKSPIARGGESEIEKLYRERKLGRQLETEKQAWQRRTKELRDSKVDITDWRERVGLRSGLRGIYSEKQDLLRRGLKDLVKKGYLKSSGSGIQGQYKATEKALKAKISPRT